MSDDTLQRLTALELSLQAEIRRLHSTVQDQAESQACVAHIRNLLTQHRGLLPTTSTTPPDIKLQLDAHRQIAADLEGQMRVAIIHSANRLRADSKNRALLGLQSGVYTLCRMSIDSFLCSQYSCFVDSVLQGSRKHSSSRNSKNLLVCNVLMLRFKMKYNAHTPRWKHSVRHNLFFSSVYCFRCCIDTDCDAKTSQEFEYIA
jgi:hypothetical protein